MDAFKRDAHVRYCLRNLRMLPHPYQAEDSSRMALAYFALSSLCLLRALDRLDDAERNGYIEWVYARQKSAGGFAGGCDVAEVRKPPCPFSRSLMSATDSQARRGSRPRWTRRTWFTRIRLC